MCAEHHRTPHNRTTSPPYRRTPTLLHMCARANHRIPAPLHRIPAPLHYIHARDNHRIPAPLQYKHVHVPTTASSPLHNGTTAPRKSGRVLGGIGTGIVSVAAPVYIVEVAPPQIRGMLGAFHQLSIVLGCLLTCAIGIPLAGKWRALSWTLLPAPCALALFSFFIPPSPRWLVTKGRTTEALKVLTSLRGDEVAAKVELHQILTASDHSGGSSGSSGSSTFTEAAEASSSPWNAAAFKAIGTATLLLVVQQLSGVGAVIINGGEIFREAGIENNNLGAMLAQLVQFVFTVVCCVTVDRLGRRTMLLFSLATMVASVVLLGWFFHNLGTDHPLPPAFAAAMVFLYFAGFAVGLGAIPWLLMAEMTPTPVRAVANGLIGSVCWLANFAVCVGFDLPCTVALFLQVPCPPPTPLCSRLLVGVSRAVGH
jgi:MFS family permease